MLLKPDATARPAVVAYILSSLNRAAFEIVHVRRFAPSAELRELLRKHYTGEEKSGTRQ